MIHSNKNNQSILASSLFKLCSSISCGTLFIITHQNTTAQFLIENGEIIGFSFDNKSGSYAIEDFKNALYWKSKFIKDYQFPLPSSAKIENSNYILSELGFNKFLKDQSAQLSERLNNECEKSESFVDNLYGFA